MMSEDEVYPDFNIGLSEGDEQDTGRFKPRPPCPSVFGKLEMLRVEGVEGLKGYTGRGEGTGGLA